MINTTNIETTTNKYKEMIKEMVNKKLSAAQLEDGWLFAKEVQYILGCSERTLVRWRQLRRQGNMNVGIACIEVLGRYKYSIEDIYTYYWNNAIA